MKRKYDEYTAAYWNFCARQRQTKIPVHITKQEFIKWWKSTNLWHLKGARSDSYCMSRLDQRKGYSLDNIICIKIKDRKFTTKL